MKIFKKENKHNVKKSWSIELNEEGSLVAVDSLTKEYLASLINFKDTWSIGEISRYYDVQTCLEKKGYDPYEHNNEYDSEGRLVIN